MKGYCFSLFIATGLLLGCGRSPEAVDKAVSAVELSDDAAAPAAMEVASQDAKTTQTATAEPLLSIPQQKKIIRSGNIAVEAKDVKASKAALDLLLKKHGGYYEQETLSGGGEYSSYSLVARIPNTHLDQFLRGVEQGGNKLTERSIQSEDVSLHYFDTASRLKSKRSYLERYQQMVGQAKNVKELLEIQEQIRQLQEEIDSQESLMRNLNDQVNYSTLRIQLFEYHGNMSNGSRSFWRELKEASVDGFVLIGDLLLGLLRLWPIFVLLLLLVVGWRRYRRSKN